MRQDRWDEVVSKLIAAREAFALPEKREDRRRPALDRRGPRAALKPCTPRPSRFARTSRSSADRSRTPGSRPLLADARPLGPAPRPSPPSRPCCVIRLRRPSSGWPSGVPPGTCRVGSSRTTLQLDRSRLDPETLPAAELNEPRVSYVRRLTDRAHRRIRLLRLADLPEAEVRPIDDLMAKAVAGGGGRSGRVVGRRDGDARAWNGTAKTSGPLEGSEGRDPAQSPGRPFLVSRLHRRDPARAYSLRHGFKKVDAYGPGWPTITTTKGRTWAAPPSSGPRHASSERWLEGPNGLACFPPGNPSARASASPLRTPQPPSRSGFSSLPAQQPANQPRSTSCSPIPPGSALAQPRLSSSGPVARGSEANSVSALLSPERLGFSPPPDPASSGARPRGGGVRHRPPSGLPGPGTRGRARLPPGGPPGSGAGLPSHSDPFECRSQGARRTAARPRTSGHQGPTALLPLSPQPDQRPAGCPGGADGQRPGRVRHPAATHGGPGAIDRVQFAPGTIKADLPLPELTTRCRSSSAARPTRTTLLGQATVGVRVAAPAEYVRVSHVEYAPGPARNAPPTIGSRSSCDRAPRSQAPRPSRSSSSRLIGSPASSAWATGHYAACSPRMVPPMTLFVKNLRRTPGAESAGTFYAQVDSYPRGIAFRATFPRDGQPTFPQEDTRPALRLRARASTPATATFRFGPRSTTPDPTSPSRSYSDGRAPGPSRSEAVRRFATAQHRRIGFSPGGPDGALLFEAAADDWSTTLDLSGIEGVPDLAGASPRRRGGTKFRPSPSLS